MEARYGYFKNTFKNSFITTINFTIFVLVFYLLLAFMTCVYAIEFAGEEEVSSSDVMEVIKNRQEKADTVEIKKQETKKDSIGETINLEVKTEKQEIKKEEIKESIPVVEEPRRADADENKSSTEHSESDALKTPVTKEKQNTTDPSTVGDYGPEKNSKKVKSSKESVMDILIVFFSLSVVSIYFLLKYKKKIKKYGCPNCQDALIKLAEQKLINHGYLHKRIDGGPDLRFSYNPLTYKKNEVYRCPKCNHEKIFSNGQLYKYS